MATPNDRCSNPVHRSATSDFRKHFPIPVQHKRLPRTEILLFLSTCCLFPKHSYIVEVTMNISSRSCPNEILRSTTRHQKSESEMFLFDPYQKYIQSNNETILDQGTPIKTSLVANIRAAYYIINNYFFISQAKNT